MEKEFLEDYPLYRKFAIELPQRIDMIKHRSLNFHCKNCKSIQTYNVLNEPAEIYRTQSLAFKPDGRMAYPIYRCEGCTGDFRYFSIYLDPKGKWMMKVGQWPAWDVSGNADIENFLGEHASHYKRGLISESQGYGIGAFAYYRRIVEEIIDGMLDEIADLLTGDELKEYRAALEVVRKTPNAADKINLVKDMLPAILRPEGMNPLSALHSVLSEGLHAESDNRCLELAMAIREVMTFLTAQVRASKAAQGAFTDHMRKLLDKKQPAKLVQS
jgi:hypothetical protein